MLEIHSLDEFRARCDGGGATDLSDCVLQGLDLVAEEGRLARATVSGTAFLGCTLPPGAEPGLRERGAVLFPRLDHLPFEPYRPHLYSAEELFAGFDPTDPLGYCDTPDARIYRHWQQTGGARPRSILEGFARRLHDQSMTDAADEFLETVDGPVVAIMGGHSLKRSDPLYADVVRLGRALARDGVLVTTGGGPGAMEAAHLGASLAHEDDDSLRRCVEHLALAPHYRDFHWLARAFDVRKTLKAEPAPSLGIPTWLYGHEPPNPFATHIAKYFANSIREDGLVTIATGGIVFAPGSAGTVQEIFQDATQNHYATLGVISPMVLLGREYWSERLPVVPLLRALAHEKPWAELVTVVDTVDEALEALRARPPREGGEPGWSFCDAFAREGRSKD